MAGYKRIHKFDIDEVLKHVGTGKPNHKFWIPHLNRTVNVGHLGTQRMKLMKLTQYCEVCLYQGTHFWLEHSGCFSPHFNLYATNSSGGEIMLTMDHILPKSKGGATCLENIQLLCRHCNHAKKNHLISNEDILRLRFRGDPNILHRVVRMCKQIKPEYVDIVKELFENRNKPVVEQDASCFVHSSLSQPSSPCSISPTMEPENQQQSS
jgi:hypothetical protein